MHQKMFYDVTAVDEKKKSLISRPAGCTENGSVDGSRCFFVICFFYKFSFTSYGP